MSDTTTFRIKTVLQFILEGASALAETRRGVADTTQEINRLGDAEKKTTQDARELDAALEPQGALRPAAVIPPVTAAAETAAAETAVIEAAPLAAASTVNRVVETTETVEAAAGAARPSATGNPVESPGGIPPRETAGATAGTGEAVAGEAALAGAITRTGEAAEQTRSRLQQAARQRVESAQGARQAATDKLQDAERARTAAAIQGEAAQQADRAAELQQRAAQQASTAAAQARLAADTAQEKVQVLQAAGTAENAEIQRAQAQAARLTAIAEQKAIAEERSLQAADRAALGAQRQAEAAAAGAVAVERKERAAAGAVQAAEREEAAAVISMRAAEQEAAAAAKFGVSAGVMESSVSRLQKAAGTLNSIGNTLLLTGAALGGGLFLASKETASYNQQIELLHTQAGVAQSDLKGISDQVLALSGQTATGPEDLAKGLYHIASAGIPAAERMNDLKIAAEGAKIGLAGTEKTANTMIAVLNSGVGGIKDAKDAMGQINAVIGAGNMRMPDLNAAFSSGVLSAAKTFGLTFKDVGAALAATSDMGIPVEEGATRLKMSFAMLAAPSHQAVEMLRGIGITTTQLASDMRQPNGLLVALQDLKQHMDNSGKSAEEQEQILSHLFGGGKSSAMIMALIGNMDRFESKYKQIGENGGKFDEALAATQQTAAYQFDQLKANVQALAISFGAAALPAINNLAKALNGLLTWFNSLDPGVKSVITNMLVFTAATSLIGGGVAKALGAFGSLGRGLKDLRELFAAGKELGEGNIFKGIVSGAQMAGGAARSLFTLILGGARALGPIMVGSARAAIPVIVEMGTALWGALAPILPVLLGIAAAMAVVFGIWKGLQALHSHIQESHQAIQPARTPEQQQATAAAVRSVSAAPVDAMEGLGSRDEPTSGRPAGAYKPVGGKSAPNVVVHEFHGYIHADGSLAKDSIQKGISEFMRSLDGAPIHAT